MDLLNLPVDFPRKNKIEEAIFIRTEFSDLEEPVFDIKRAKLMQYTDDIEICSLVFNNEVEDSKGFVCDNEKHVSFNTAPPEEFPTFTSEEYDRKSISPKPISIDYYSLWCHKQELDLHLQV